MTLMVASLGLALVPVSKPSVRKLVRRTLHQHLEGATGFLTTTTATRDKRRRARLKRARRANPLPEIDGSIGVVGTYHLPVYAHGLRAESGPVMAHYEVWTPRNVALVDQYLASAGAPRFLVRAANYSSASNELTLARHYRTVESQKYYTVLRRRDAPLSVATQVVLEQTVGWGETIGIPREYRDSVLVADVRYAPNILGRIVGFLHHPPHVEMVLERRRGRSVVLINRLVSDTGVVLAAGKGEWGSGSRGLHKRRHPILTEVKSKVTGVSLRAQTVGSEASGLFEPTLHVRIRAIVFGPDAADP